MQVVFIRHEDKVNLLEKLFPVRGSEINEDHGLRIKSASVEGDSLLYSWGNARNGKLGLSDNYTQDYIKNIPFFYIDDSLEQMNDDLEAFKMELGITKDESKDMTTEELKDLMEFESKQIFTPRP